MQSSSPADSPANWSRTLESLVHGQLSEFPAHEVFMQTLRGAQAAARGPGDLPDRLRMLLYLVNGRRRMTEYRDLLPRYRNLDDAFDMLLKKGYIERHTVSGRGFAAPGLG